MADADDVAYLRRHFLPLEELCARRGDDPGTVRALVDAGRLPAPAYVADGVEWVAPDHLDLADEAGGADALRRRFEERYVLAADTYGAVAGPDELDLAWEAYLRGEYARRYREATPESAVRVLRLAGSIGRLLGAPAPEDWRWRDRLRGRVEQAAELLRPGCALDPPADEDDDDPPLYASLVTVPRERFPGAFP